MSDRFWGITYDELGLNGVENPGAEFTEIQPALGLVDPAHVTAAAPRT